MAETTTAVATKSKVEQTQEFAFARANKIAELIPAGVKNYDPRRQIRQFAIEAIGNPKLMDCTKESVLIALCQAAAVGLEIGSGLGHAYLVPYNRNIGNRDNPKWVSEAKLIPGYKGLTYLAVRSGAARSIYAEKVCDGDEFTVDLGTEPKIVHRPDYARRGKAIAYYAVAQLHGGGTQFTVMTHAEVEAVRARSKSKDNGPWVSDFDEMAKKTVVRRLAKMLPITTDEQRVSFLRACAADEATDHGDAIDVSTALGIEHEAEQPKALPTSGGVIDAALDAALPQATDAEATAAAALDAKVLDAVAAEAGNAAPVGVVVQ